MPRARKRTPSAPTPLPPAKPAPAKPAPHGPKPHAAALPPSTWTDHALPLASLAILAALIYAPSVNGPFVYDDPNAVSQSGLVRSLTPLARFVTLSTRPLSDFSFALNYAMSGLDTWSYHATSILLHVLNALMVYGIAWATFGTAPLAHSYGRARRALAWAAALLFAVHPLASESVAYISSRSEVLASFFILFALGSFIVAATTARRRLRQIGMIALPLATAAGVGSKEIAATIPFLLLLYNWLFLGSLRQRAALRRNLILLAVLPLALGGAFLVVRAYVSPSPMGDYGSTAGIGFDRFTRWEYLMSQFGVIAYYLRLVVLPIGQTFDYDWPLARTPFALGVVVPLLLLAALVAVAVRSARTQPLITFAVGWTLIILAPTSSVMPIADLAVERRMYLPLAGIALLAAAFIWDLVGHLPAALRARPAWTYAALVAVPLGAFAALTVHRAELWGHAIALHEDGVLQTPDNPRVRLNLGVTYLNSGDPDRARDTLQIAKQLYDRGESLNAFTRIGAFIEYNLGAVLFAQKDFDGAERSLKRSLELGGQYLALRPMAFMLLSRIEAQRGDYKQSVVSMQEAVKYQDTADWRVDLAQYQLRAGDAAGARSNVDYALRLDPQHKRAKVVLAELNKKQ